MRAEEREAVLTTIVGGRPPGSGKSVGNIPRGIEVLVKKASVDPDFKNLLLEHRAGAANEIGLELNPAEAAMLGAIPRDQLEKIIEQTEVPQASRRAFLGKVAVAMVAALGLDLTGCGDGSNAPENVQPVTLGIQPRRLPQGASKGIRADRPMRNEDLPSTGSMMQHSADQGDQTTVTEPNKAKKELSPLSTETSNPSFWENCRGIR